MVHSARRRRRPLEVIHRLQATHGPLMFFQSGGCCEGTSPLSLEQAELPLSPHDVSLGEIAGAPFYIDSEQYERWGRPHLSVEVSPGAAEGCRSKGWRRFTSSRRPDQ